MTTLQPLKEWIWSLLAGALIAVPLCLTSCSMFKSTAKTANDVAREACGAFASAREEQLGMSAKDWCNLRANLEPFLDVVLSAERKAGIGTSAGTDDPGHAEPAP